MSFSHVLVLAYSGCQTCRNAIRWLTDNEIPHTVRSIVDEPPTSAELARWIPESGVGVRKWLNTSGLSYRALGKEKVDAASDEEITQWLTRDGKLVKRPVVVAGRRVLLGFKPDLYEKELLEP